MRNLGVCGTREIEDKVNKHVFNTNDWGDWSGEPVLEDSATSFHDVWWGSGFETLFTYCGNCFIWQHAVRASSGFQGLKEGCRGWSFGQAEGWERRLEWSAKTTRSCGLISRVNRSGLGEKIVVKRGKK